MWAVLQSTIDWIHVYIENRGMNLRTLGVLYWLVRCLLFLIWRVHTEKIAFRGKALKTNTHGQKYLLSHETSGDSRKTAMTFTSRRHLTDPFKHISQKTIAISMLNLLTISILDNRVCGSFFHCSIKLMTFCFREHSFYLIWRNMFSMPIFE